MNAVKVKNVKWGYGLVVPATLKMCMRGSMSGGYDVELVLAVDDKKLRDVLIDVLRIQISPRKLL